MTILALEFSSSQRSVAVAHRNGITEAIETGGHGTNAFGLIEEALLETRLDRSQIDVLAVGLGPGSYTGIRVALSIAQGWQLARGVKLLGISSAECLAAQVHAANIFGRVNVVIDAQRNEFYRATYDISHKGWTDVEPLRITNPTSAVGTAEELWAGPEVTRWFPNGTILFPSAATLARLATNRTDFKSGDQLAPIYLREANFVKAPPPNPVAI